MRWFLAFVACLIQFNLTAHVRPISLREAQLISHVEMSLANAENRISKLTPKVLEIEGMSSSKVRHLLNNLCSLPDANYLEIGCWAGSTWIAALFENQSTLSSAVAIDNWSEFGGPQKTFFKNCSKFLKSVGYKVYSENCFAVDARSLFVRPVNIYFYDGNHAESSQEKAFTYYDCALDDPFIAIVDDWSWESVQKGTRKAFESLNYEILFEKELPCRKEGSDRDQWWNGFYVAVIRKVK